MAHLPYFFDFAGTSISQAVVGIISKPHGSMNRITMRESLTRSTTLLRSPPQIATAHDSRGVNTSGAEQRSKRKAGSFGFFTSAAF
jgi:hypothetical protein